MGLLRQCSERLLLLLLLLLRLLLVLLLLLLLLLLLPPPSPLLLLLSVLLLLVFLLASVLVGAAGAVAIRANPRKDRGSSAEGQKPCRFWTDLPYQGWVRGGIAEGSRKDRGRIEILSGGGSAEGSRKLSRKDFKVHSIRRTPYIKNNGHRM